MKYLYYAKRKKDVAKILPYNPLTEVALIDEGFYTLAINVKIEGKTLSELEKMTGQKAEKRKIYVIGKRGKRKLIC